MSNSNHSNVLIIGGGCAGISVAARLHSLKNDLSISIIEPSDKSLYQAAWTLVGAGAYDKDKTIKPMSEVMPSYVNWIKSYAESFSPDTNAVKTSTGDYTYDYLIVCPGLKINYDGIDDYMLVGPIVSLSGNFTLSWWYKNTSGGTPSGYRNFIGGGNALSYGCTLNGGVWKTYTAGSPTWEPMSDSVIDGNWYNLTVVNDNSNTNWTSYQNGQFFKTFTLDYSSTTLSRIGCRSNQSRFMLGSIGTVYAYNRILSANEVLHNYNALKGRFGLT